MHIGDPVSALSHGYFDMIPSMSLADRLGLGGLVVALFAIAAPYLWPDKKWIGWLSFGFAGILVLGWCVLEVRQMLDGSSMSLYVSIGIVTCPSGLAASSVAS